MVTHALPEEADAAVERLVQEIGRRVRVLPHSAFCPPPTPVTTTTQHLAAR